MKKVRLLVLETHYFNKKTGQSATSGVDFARVINPGNALKNHPDFEVSIRKDPIAGYPQQNWDDLTKAFDLIYTSYIDSPVGYVSLAIHAKKNGCLYISDVDDNLWEVPNTSPVYQTYHPGSEQLNFVSNALEDTSYITTTNMFLKYRLVKYLAKDHDKVKVFPNYIDLSLYDASKIPVKKKDTIDIVYYGTNTHGPDIMQDDVVKALERICKENPKVHFSTVGFFLPQMKQKLKRQYHAINGEQNFDKWVLLWGEMMGLADIVIAPLVDTDFNKCKSNIKFLEYSAAKKPGVYQDIRQYQEVIKMYKGRPTGFLASRFDSWYKNLKTLTESESLRRGVGDNAYSFVKENHTVQGHVEEFAEYFKGLMDAPEKQFSSLAQSGFILPGQK